jgi:triacylglycerol lipase
MPRLVRRRAGMVAALAAAALVATGGAAPTALAQGELDPSFSVPEEDLAAALDCPDQFVHADREPVLLVHGTFTAGHEQYGWNYLLALPPLGFDVCVVTYPDRGMGDQQVSAEYVAWAVMEMHRVTGRQVDLVGHSQGASMPRWAVKHWPSVRAVVDDYVAIAAPHHGILLGSFGTGGQMPAAFHQFAPGSAFVRILNEGDQTPGDVHWTNLYSEHDELVQPVQPEPTAALDWGQDNPRVANILLQDLCPARVVDHLTIGTTDRLAFDLVVDALANDGPADPTRLDLGPECTVADQFVDAPAQTAVFGTLFVAALSGGFPDLHLASEEPATMPYALASTDGDGEAAGGTDDPVTNGAPANQPDPPAALPATGGGLPLLALLLAVAAAMGGIRRTA